MVDVVDLIFMLAHDPITAIWLTDYLYPEKKAQEEEAKKREADEQERRRQEERWQITALRMLAKCKPKNDDEAQRMVQLKESLSHGN